MNRYLAMTVAGLGSLVLIGSFGIVLFIIFTFIGCSPAESAGQYAMTCEIAGETRNGYVDRCENAEVICYESQHGISCFKKGN